MGLLSIGSLDLSRVGARTDFEHILKGRRVPIEYESVDHLLAAFGLDTVNGVDK